MTGVLLLTFGSAVTADDVPAYLASVRGGRTVPDELVAEFQRRYRRVGRSPLIDITRDQARCLQEALDADDGPGVFIVDVGMLHSDPRVASACDTLAAKGVRRVIAVVLAPQYSPIIMAGYERAVAQARADHPGVDIVLAPKWHDSKEWVDCLAGLLHDAIADLPDDVSVIFTAHSLPRAVVDRDPGYIEQLLDTAHAVARRAALRREPLQFAYQSAGHTPEPWLTPDVKELLPDLRAQGCTDVLVVPVQFVADHLEVLYDIDVAAYDEAAAAGMRLHRIAMPNAAPAFIRTLAAVVHREVAAA
jgi:protoporphyrin/coproporphyrin ferrochelatase